MKTLIACIVAAIIASSNGLFFSNLIGGGRQNQGPQEYLHHHHHHHEVVHKSIGEGHQQSGFVKYIENPVEVQPLHVQIYKVIHEHAPQHHGGEGYGIEQDHGPVFHQAPAHVITKYVQPIVNKNFIHSQHQHHYHQIASAPAHHHGWD